MKGFLPLDLLWGMLKNWSFLFHLRFSFSFFCFSSFPRQSSVPPRNRETLTFNVNNFNNLFSSFTNTSFLLFFISILFS